MTKQILVKAYKDKQDGESFGKVSVTTSKEFSLSVGTIFPVKLPFDLETVNVFDQGSLNFIWVIDPGLAKHGVALIGASWKKGVVTAYLTAFKDVKVTKNVTVLEGYAIETISLRNTSIENLLQLDGLRAGAEL